MTTSNSVGILFISSVICLTHIMWCAHIISSSKTHFLEDDNSTMASRTRSINVIRVLHNNGSQARTTYIPDLIETKDLSTRTDYEFDSIIKDSVKKKKKLHSPKFQQCKLEQKNTKKYEVYYKLISKPIQNNTRKDKYYIVIHMFKFCYLNSSKNYNYLGSNESIIKTAIFKPSLKIRHAIVKKGNQLSKKALVKIVCRLPCHKDDSFKTKILENNETADGNTQHNYNNSGKFPKCM